MDNQAAAEQWDEAQIDQAMKRLKLLHIKVRAIPHEQAILMIKVRLLRDTIPKMINPLVQKQPSRKRHPHV